MKSYEDYREAYYRALARLACALEEVDEARADVRKAASELKRYDERKESPK